MPLWKNPTLQFIVVLLLAPVCGLAGESFSTRRGDELELTVWLLTAMLIAGAAIRSARYQWKESSRMKVLQRGVSILPPGHFAKKLFLGSCTIAVFCVIIVFALAGKLIAMLLKGHSALPN